VNSSVNSARSRAVSIRTRLTLLYGGLFVIAGALLVVIFLAIFRGNYPSGPSVDRILSSTGKLSPAEVRTIRQQLDLHRARDLSAMTAQSLIALAAVTAAALALGWAMAGRVLAPVRRITQIARRVAGLHLDERIALQGPDDELKELADTFDAMLDQLAASLTAQRQFVASASHELRTPLATNRTMLEVALAGGRVPAELRPLVDGVLETNQRSELIIDGLLTLARSDGQVLAPVPVDLSDIAASAVEQTAHEAASAKVEVDTTPLPAATVGDHVLLEHVALNLVRNGIRHNHPGGWLKISTAPGPNPGEAQLTVINTGPVVPADQLDVLFQPFRRMECSRVSNEQGVGLGLSIVASVVHSHRGRLVTEPRPDGGLRVQVILPNHMERLCSSPTFAASCCGARARRSSSRWAWRWASAWSSP
jgi:signal transduction histidine kinase